MAQWIAHWTSSTQISDSKVVGSNPTRVGFISTFSFLFQDPIPSTPTYLCVFHLFSVPTSFSLLSSLLTCLPQGLGHEEQDWGEGRGQETEGGGKEGVDAEIKAGPWLGDTPGFNNHFIPCTRDSRKSWAGGREGTILDARWG